MLRRWLLCLLALVLLLQASTALVAATLGPRHTHAPEPPRIELLDLRRGLVMASVPAAGPGRARAIADDAAHHAAHAAAQRHHHGIGAAGVEHDAASALTDALSAAASMLAAWFPAAPAPACAAPLPGAHAAPVPGPGWFVGSAERALPERPPRGPRPA